MYEKSEMIKDIVIKSDPLINLYHRDAEFRAAIDRATMFDTEEAVLDILIKALGESRGEVKRLKNQRIECLEQHYRSASHIIRGN